MLDRVKNSPDRGLHVTFSIILFSLIYLQKISLPLGGDQQVSLTILPFYAGVAYGLGVGVLQVNAVRLLLYAVLMITMTASALASGAVLSAPGLLLILIVYLPFVTEARVTREQFLKLGDVFQNLMIVPCVIVFVQILFEFGSGYHTLSLEPLLPKPFLMQGFLYEAPYRFGQRFVRANGFFMLEPSFIAMFAACALVVEVSVRRRLGRMALYAGALGASLGATGYVLAAAAAPVLLARLPPRAFVALALLALLAGVGAVASGAAEGQLSRLGELGTPGTSGYGRVTQPFEQLITAAERPEALVTGVGAGNIEKGASTWPVTRVVLEYGFIPALAFLVFQVATFAGTPWLAAAVGLFVVFNFTGGYLPNPVPIILTYVLVAAVRIDRERKAVARPTRLERGGSFARLGPAPATGPV